MTKIKMCGIRSESDVEYANKVNPEFVGFVFVKESKRAVTAKTAAMLHQKLRHGILSVGVFADDAPDFAADLVQYGIIDIIQLHGRENNGYIADLRGLTSAPIIKAFKIEKPEDVVAANESDADFVMLDSGGGTGTEFDHSLIKYIHRPFFLAGGLTPENVGDAVHNYSPYAVDVSSALESGGSKDFEKMKAFAEAVRSNE